MQWRDNLRNASFRNVPFEVERHSLSGGRRVVSHEYPNRDVPYVEDLGAKQRSFSLTAFVVGTDYMTKRDSLIKALEAPGIGVLIHPYLGTMNVMVSTYSMDESNDNGGMASFSIEFVQAEVVKYPEYIANPFTEINRTGQEVIAKIAVLSDQSMTTEGYPSAVIDNAVTAITAIANEMILEAKNISRTKQTATVGIYGRISEIDEYLKEANKLTLQAKAYVSRPATLAYQISNIVSRIPNIVNDAVSAFRSYFRSFVFVYDYFYAQSWIGTPAGLASMNNASYIRNMTLSSILANAAKVAVGIEYETNEQAYGVRNSLTEMFDKLLNVVDDDALYETIADLKNATVTAIPPEGVRLQDVVYVDVNEPVPSLVFVADQYGDIDAEEDFIKRNKIQNPWIVPGGSVVEVLK